MAEDRDNASLQATECYYIKTAGAAASAPIAKVRYFEDFI